MTLRITSSDISPFSGYEHRHNKEIDFYLDLFCRTKEITHMIFSCEDYSGPPLSFICYISDYIHNKGIKTIMFTTTYLNDNGKPTEFAINFTKAED